MKRYSLLSPELPLIRVGDEIVLIDLGATHSVWDVAEGSPFLEEHEISDSPRNMLLGIERIRNTIAGLVPDLSLDALVGADALAGLEEI
jgi:hypothetical protein